MDLSELTLDREGLAAAIAREDAAFEAALREEAYRVKVATVGPEVYLRGLIEISNICVKNCLYCGIRRDIRCPRYELSDEEVLATARLPDAPASLLPLPASAAALAADPAPKRDVWRYRYLRMGDARSTETLASRAFDAASAFAAMDDPPTWLDALCRWLDAARAKR